ncbi:MAG TPA: alanine racemase [Balneolales bacterium]|nr:alanine racemase [Balneolales bacterium]
MDKIEKIRTPALLINLAALRNNAESMIERACWHSLKLRPHVKTHKTLEGARYQLGDRFHAITVSTLAEARFYADAGYKDMTYAVPISPDKLDEAAYFTKNLDHFGILLDNPDIFEKVEAYALQNDVTFEVWVPVDTGNHREGVDPLSYDAIALVHQIFNSDVANFKGILSHAGHAYSCKSAAEIQNVAEDERSIMVVFANKLRRNNIACPAVSVGSTPTCVHGKYWEGITEIRPGNYIFFDLYMTSIGVCQHEDCAATVLTRVIGHYPKGNRMLIDAGALALSKDRGPIHINPDPGYGYIKENPNLKIHGLSQEHGFVSCQIQIDFKQYPIGSLLHIIPNHSCLTAALFPEYHVVEGDTVIDQWKPVRGW